MTTEPLPMSIISMICPSCGAPVQMPAGRVMCFCEYCGGQVKLQLSEAETAREERSKGFVDAIRASIHCIRSSDYKKAMEYADEAEKIEKNDPAPMLIRYISTLSTDYKKATPYLSIAKSMRSEAESRALSDEEYRQLLSIYVLNYLSDRDQDFKRIFMTMKKVRPADIQNVNNYEHLKRIDSYYADADLKEAFMSTSSEYLTECEESLKVSGQMDQATWDVIEDTRKNRLFRAAGTLFVNPSLKQRFVAYMEKYNNALNLKWEIAFKKDVNGSKDQVRSYRSESEALLVWAKSLR